MRIRFFLLNAILVIVVGLLLSGLTFQSSGLYEIKNGKVDFKSDAPLELIEAHSNELKGLVDFHKQTFAFSASIASFEGFNSSLQKEHFNENYMEAVLFPKATFSGRIIEPTDISVDGVYLVRAKGMLTIHGQECERILRVQLTVRQPKIQIDCQFTVPLEQHKITIPKVVQQKIAEEIFVTINAVAVKK